MGVGKQAGRLSCIKSCCEFLLSIQIQQNFNLLYGVAASDGLLVTFTTWVAKILLYADCSDTHYVKKLAEFIYDVLTSPAFQNCHHC